MTSLDNSLIPHNPVLVLGDGPVIALVAQPGDEAFGCGGALARHVQTGDQVVVVVASGDETSSVEIPSITESRACATCLGYDDIRFWSVSSAHLAYDEGSVRRVMQLIAEIDAALLYAPFPEDPDPVRARWGLIARESVRRAAGRCCLAAYEIGVPLTPNRLLDITTTLERKQQAMACFPSRLTTPLDQQTLALNRVRTFNLPASIAAAEGYWLAASAEIPDCLPGLAARPFRRAFQSTIAPGSLVSVVIRSAGRVTLDEALDSIAAQTYRHVEVILVDVTGCMALTLPDWCGEFPLRRVSTGAPLGRGAAANVGLAAASGEFVIFLDDDDWFLPEHLAGLVEAIKTADGASAAYAGVECRTQCADGERRVLHVFNEAHDPVRLLVENYLPIHAVLFSRHLLGDDLRFDEALHVYEDWDFWIQLSALTDLVHVNAVTAVYRIAQSSGFGIRHADPAVEHGRAALFAKWRSRWSLEQLLVIADYAKHRSMYLELRERGERDVVQMSDLYKQFERVRADLEQSQVQFALLSAEKGVLDEQVRGLHERILVNEAYCRAAESERDASREWLGLLGIEQLDDVLKCRDELARYRAFQGRMRSLGEWVVRPFRGPRRAFKRATLKMVVPLSRSASHLWHLVLIIQAFGPLAVLRALRSRLGSPGTIRRNPSLADLWQVIELESIALPSSHPRPLVSILIDLGIQSLDLRYLLEGLAKTPNAPPIEVLLLCPREHPVAALLQTRLQKMRIVQIDDTKGFAARLSAVLAQCKADWLLLTVNASLHPVDWLSRLLDAGRDAQTTGTAAGAVCAKVIGTDGWLVEAGILRTHDGKLLHLGAGGDPQAPEYNYLREVDAASDVCLLLNQEAVRQALAASVSPVDTFGLMHLFEGMRSRGWSVLYQPEVTATVTSPEPCAPALLETSRKRLLVLDAVMPTPDQDSGSLRMTSLLEIFLDLGWHVTFVPSNLELCAPYGPYLRRRGIEVLYRPLVGSIPTFLEQRGASFDLVILSRHYVATAFLDVVHLHAPQAWVWFDTVDLHYLREQREAKLRGDPVALKQAVECKRQEIDLMRRSDLTLVVSPVERDLLATEAPDVRVEILSNIHSLHPTETPFAARDAIVFIGGFNHTPNVDAVEYYVNDILPLVRAQLGAVPTYLIGSRPPQEVLALDAPDQGLHVTGYVEDVTPFFARARLSIAPLRYGAGVKGKINMSMAYGVPTVATPCAGEGMFLRPETDILIGGDAAAFAAAVVRLYRDQTLWESIAANGLANIETHFSRQTAQVILKRLLSERF